MRLGLASVFALAVLTIATTLSSSENVEEKARHAAQKLHKLAPDVGLTLEQYHKLAFFIETELPEWLARRGTYLSRKRTHLPRSLEYDPETGNVYIHLRLHGGLELLGRGTKKIVMHSILYHPEQPQRVAHCQTEKPVKSEMAAIRALRNVEGVVDVKSIMKRKSRGRKPVISLMCKLYMGSLSRVMKRDTLSLRQKLELACDVLQALHAMHSREFVHRDICPQNFLVEKEGQRLRAVVCDFGRALGIKDAVGSSTAGHLFFIPPEGFRYKRLSKQGYYAADVYAVGTMLYQLFYDKEAPWVDYALIKNHAMPAKKRAAKHGAHLKKFHKKMRAQLKRQESPSLQAKAQVLQMIHPNPKKRGTAEENLNAMQNILRLLP